MSYDKPQVEAGGTIEPARFIKLSTAADYTVLQAGTNERVFGISMDASAAAPISGAATAAAVADGSLNYFGNGEVATLELGSGGITRGAFLKSDTDGKGVAAATTGATMQEVGAQALESGSAGEKVRVVVYRQQFYPALA